MTRYNGLYDSCGFVHRVRLKRQKNRTYRMRRSNASNPIIASSSEINSVSEIRLSLLGPPNLTRDSAPLKMGRRKAFALLSYLAVTNQSQRRETLAALFWPDSGSSLAFSIRLAVSPLSGSTLFLYVIFLSQLVPSAPDTRHTAHSPASERPRLRSARLESRAK